MRKTFLAVALAVLSALPAAAQHQPTLADLRAELSRLSTELQGLRGQLMASGAAGFEAAGGDSAIDRMNAMERQLSVLTDRTEQLQNRINRIVEDGTRRIGDIEFRLCEMDESCDLGALTSPELGGLATGGVTMPTLPQQHPAAPAHAPAATAAEQAEFDAANAALGAGDFGRAAQLFGTLAQRHAGGPLTAEALFLRGAALESAGDARAAASAWLESFAADPDGPRSPESLLGIARVIATEGDTVASCLYLAEVPARFPGSSSADEAERRMTVLDCGSADLGLAEGTALPEDGLADGLDPEAAADMAEHE
ncbi:tol-pal system protein [Paracoccus sp. (in: a-proteobacteria)]|uniref:tol-pal system protein n=1 Tax=Paracoccus sp. TaxID=267 RepID=UPI003A857002